MGLYLLRKLSALVNKASIHLYRDDDLAVVSNISGPTLDRLRKRIIVLFKEENLSITIKTSLSSTDFLDVTLDLRREKYYPYRKPNNKLSYINARSNHPPTIIKDLPIMVNKIISDLSCDKDEFDKAKDDYELALRKTGTTQPSSTSPPSKTANGKGTVNAISSGSFHHTNCNSSPTSEKKIHLPDQETLPERPQASQNSKHEHNQA